MRFSKIIKTPVFVATGLRYPQHGFSITFKEIIHKRKAHSRSIPHGMGNFSPFAYFTFRWLEILACIIVG